MKTKGTRTIEFGLCINNRGYAVSLEIGKLYVVVPDEEAASHGYIRVVDESGDDYGYSAERSFVLQLPQAVARALASRNGRTGRSNRVAAAPRGRAFHHRARRS